MRRSSLLSLLATSLLTPLVVAGPVSAQPAARGSQHLVRPHPASDGSIVFAESTDDSTSISVTTPPGGRVSSLVDFGYDPRWSPDGRLIAVAGCADSAVASRSPCATTVINRHGRTIRTVDQPRTFAGTDTAFGPSVWSPAGRRLVGGADSSDRSLNGLYSLALDGPARVRRLTSNSAGIDIPGSYSPNGRWVLFVRDVYDSDDNPVAQGLFEVRASGTGVHRVTPPQVLTNPEHGGRFSPDGRWILFDARPDASARFTLWLIRPDGSQLHRIPINAIPCGAPSDAPASFGCFAPAWSPNGHRIVFATLSSTTGARDIYSADVDGSRVHPLTQGDTGDDVPDWGPR